jgi:hypothetical protein
MASGDVRLYGDSAIDKIAEFQQLGYYRGTMLWDACSKMGATNPAMPPIDSENATYLRQNVP